ncbi:alkaline phosphatase family protein [Alteromonas sediminis]|uniref:Alkaline phosphatase family protein n=1 Tax=Alteromonas sediminis TaxID=2259342 RepID=A0A3N5Y6V4_9ALTE|nr:alkaline phosphatase family protein [Alteromonas sediminis]RPJ66269.1 alkaline phosphatase family protein [Alteromonas sediminis]
MLYDHDPLPLPKLLAGPILRSVNAHAFTVWLVTTSDEDLHLSCSIKGSCTQRKQQIGEHAFIYLLTYSPEKALTPDTEYTYDVMEKNKQGDAVSLTHEHTHLHYAQRDLHFYYRPTLTNVVHGSCRKPHYEGEDALTNLDKVIETSLSNKDVRPDLLLMTGDQVYTDDVAGPMLQAIHQICQRLGLFTESLDGSVIESSEALFSHHASYYRRDELLPKIDSNETLLDTFFGAKKKPIFTSVHAKNHLIGLNEMLAMYLLVWSPLCWKLVTFTSEKIDDQYKAIYHKEQQAIEAFVSGLSAIQRVLAHIPVYMIFDDHDITDDWNLTRNWEEIVYGHPLSKRIIGNALVAYWLCQGWGNTPDRFDDIHHTASDVLKPGMPNLDNLIDQLLEWDQWHYQLDTSPTLYVLDTRTQRWRSESNGNKPSGLMDWEALCEFQHGIIGHDKVIVVSAAPIYGVKLIEAIQRIFTALGHALTVDAENWMAHKGTASVILNIFRHIKTPPLFIILSGDVHYSFVYDVSLKFRRNSPRIVQFTCSGIKNVFPDKLINFFDRLNQVLYASRSPLNWFTKRRTMKIKTRHPKGVKGRTLVNTCALGQLFISPDNDKVDCRLLKADGNTIEFESQNDE